MRVNLTGQASGLLTPRTDPSVDPNTVNVDEIRAVALRETTGAAGAVVRFRDGTVAGEIILPVSLAAGESTRDIFDGLLAYSGKVYYEVVSGSVEGSVVLQ